MFAEPSSRKGGALHRSSNPASYSTAPHGWLVWVQPSAPSRLAQGVLIAEARDGSPEIKIAVLVESEGNPNRLIPRRKGCVLLTVAQFDEIVDAVDRALGRKEAR